MTNASKALSKIGTGTNIETLDEINALKRDISDAEYDRVLEIQSAVDAAIADAIPYVREIIMDPDAEPETRVAAIRVLSQGLGQYASRRREYVGDVKSGKGAVFNINMPDYSKKIVEGEVLSE